MQGVGDRPRRTMSPITLRVNVPEIQALLLAQGDIRSGPGDLSRHERPPTTGALVVEQDPVAREHPVRLAVVDDNPVRVELRATVRRSGVERRGLTLGSLHHLAIQLRCRGLVEFDVLL